MRRKADPVNIAIIILLTASFIAINPALPAHADAAPPPPPFGANPNADNPNTQVQMVSERVVFDIAAKSASPHGSAAVTATFHMQNQAASGEERMLVRFPLGSIMQDLQCMESADPPISDLTVRVDGQPVATTTSEQSVYIYGADPPKKEPRPCWANFPVVFPAGKEVTLEVRYTALAYSPTWNGKYPDDSMGFAGESPTAGISFWYILQTGAGWAGKIGSADVIFRFPYPVNDQNVVLSSLDQHWKATGQELTWHKESFEPDGDLRINLIEPAVWQTVLKETQATLANPKDGKAWGRLGEAYARAAWVRRGFRRDPGGVEMYRLSHAAYQQALLLEPKNLAWHASYADLLCWRAEWGDPTDPNGTLRTDPDWKPCLQQLKLALDLAHWDGHVLTVLATIERMSNGTAIKMDGNQPDYLALTPLPSPTATFPPTETPTPTQTSSPEPTRVPTAIPIRQPVTIRPTAAPATIGQSGFLTPTGIGLILVVVFGGIFWFSRRIKK